MCCCKVVSNFIGGEIHFGYHDSDTTGDNENNDDNEKLSLPMCRCKVVSKFMGREKHFGYRDSETGDNENNDDHPCVAAKLCPSSWANVKKVAQASSRQADTVVP